MVNLRKIRIFYVNLRKFQKARFFHFFGVFWLISVIDKNKKKNSPSFILKFRILPFFYVKLRKKWLNLVKYGNR